jgi:hypothetical protein
MIDMFFEVQYERQRLSREDRYRIPVVKAFSHDPYARTGGFKIGIFSIPASQQNEKCDRHHGQPMKTLHLGLLY